MSRHYVSSVLTKYTQNDGMEIRNIFSSYVDDIIINNCISQSGYINDGVESILKIEEANNPHSKSGSCFLPFNRLYVTYEGYLTLCCADYQNYVVVEDLNNMSLKEAWYSEKFQKIRQRHIDEKLEGTLCYNCLKNTVSYIKPISEEFAYPYCQSSNEDLDMVRSRIDRLLESDVEDM